MDVDKVLLYILQQIESDAATKNVRDSIKKGLYIKDYYQESFKKIFTPLLESQFGIKKSIENQQYALANELADGFENVLQRIDRYLDDVKIKEDKQEVAQMGVRDIQQGVQNLLPDQQVQIQPQAIQPLLQIQDAVDQGIRLIEQAAIQQPPQPPPEQVIRLIVDQAAQQQAAQLAVQQIQEAANRGVERIQQVQPPAPATAPALAPAPDAAAQQQAVQQIQDAAQAQSD